MDLGIAPTQGEQALEVRDRRCAFTRLHEGVGEVEARLHVVRPNAQETIVFLDGEFRLVGRLGFAEADRTP